MRNNEKVADAFMGELVLYGVMAPGAEDAIRMAFERMPALGNGSIFKDDGEAVARVLWDDKAAGTVKLTMIAVEPPPVGAFLYLRPLDPYVDGGGRVWAPCDGYASASFARAITEIKEELNLAHAKLNTYESDKVGIVRSELCLKACEGITDEKLESWLNPPEGQFGAPHGPWTSHIVELNKEVMEKIKPFDFNMENLKRQFVGGDVHNIQWDFLNNRFILDSFQIRFLQFIIDKMKAAHE